ncbi:metallophosphoesterase [Arthrobacter crystallopoietes]|uniref:metallophosphoesterase family protein n=1 Tax=Crystallibacter crystallopoietes TaxID=37928 RepID=UPI003D24149A
MSETAKPIAVAGDWHGDVPWMRAVVDTAAAAGAELLLHVGDLAVLWPGRDKGKFDRRLQQRLELRDMQFIFVDGNHDNHHELRLLPLDDDGLAPLRPRIRYLPRGARFTYSGMTIAGLGGAYSIDQQWRTTGKDWWPDEDVTDEDVNRLIAGGPVDILITHDAPDGVRVKSDLDLPPDVLEASEETRTRLRRAVDALRPASVFAGHWHQRVIEIISHPGGAQTRVDVLNMNSSRDGNAVLVWPGSFPLRVESLRIGSTRREEAVDG